MLKYQNIRHLICLHHVKYIHDICPGKRFVYQMLDVHTEMKIIIRHHFIIHYMHNNRTKYVLQILAKHIGLYVGNLKIKCYTFTLYFGANLMDICVGFAPNCWPNYRIVLAQCNSETRTNFYSIACCMNINAKYDI